MNPLNQIAAAIKTALPRSEISIDAPEASTGKWYLDVSLGRKRVVIERRAGGRYGISSPGAADFGEGPHESFENAGEVQARAVQLLSTRQRTRSSRELVLKALRKRRKVSQEELAKRLNIRQANISKLERRSDVKVSSLKNIVESLGGRLEVRAIFADETVTIVQFDEHVKPPKTRERA